MPSRMNASERNWHTFATRYPAEAAWLQSPASGDFGASLIKGCKRYGGLTMRQLAAVQRNVTQVASATDPDIAFLRARYDSGEGFVDTPRGQCPIHRILRRMEAGMSYHDAWNHAARRALCCSRRGSRLSLQLLPH